MSLESLAAELNENDRRYLLRLSRISIEEFVNGKVIPEVPESDLTAGLKLCNSCFVTLRIGKALRGCIGSIGPSEPLYKRVIESSISTATRDPRFEAVRAHELKRIRINISVLTDASLLPHSNDKELLDSLEPGRHGVIIKKGYQSATYLPQVWKMVPDKETFLSELCRKAGLREDAWRNGGTRVEIFESLSFAEEGYEEDMV